MNRMPRLVKRIAGAVLLLAAAGLWLVVMRWDPRPYLFPPREDRTIERLLDQRVTVVVNDEPCGKALRRLAAEYGVPLQLEKWLREEADAEAELQRPVFLSAKQLPLRAVFYLLLAQISDSNRLRIAEAPREAILYVESPLAEQPFQRRVTRVLPFPGSLAAEGVSETDLQRAAHELLADSELAERWIESLAGAWLVTGSPRMQRQTAQLLEAFRKPVAAGSHRSRSAVERNARDNRRIERALRRKRRYAFYDIPRLEALEEIAADLEAPLVVDYRALMTERIRLDDRITSDIYDVSGAAALRLLLNDVQLTFDVCDGALLVTTPSLLQRRQSIRLYPIGDLLADAGTEDARGELASFVQAFAAPSDPVVRDTVCLQLGDWLALRNSWVAHQRVERLLTALRKARQATHPTTPIVVGSPREQQIRDLLERPWPRVLRDLALAELTDELQRELKINVHLTSTITGTQRLPYFPAGVPLREALRFALTRVGYRALVVNDSLVLTDNVVPYQGSELVTTVFPRPPRLTRTGEWLDLWDLAEMIDLMIGSSGLHVGGLVAYENPAVVGELLVLRHTARDVAWARRLLRQAYAAELGGPLRAEPARVGSERTNWSFDLLHERITIDVTEVPLEQAAQALSIAANRPVRLATQSPQSSRGRPQSHPLPAAPRVSVRAVDEPLGLVLGRLLTGTGHQVRLEDEIRISATVDPDTVWVLQLPANWAPVAERIQIAIRLTERKHRRKGFRSKRIGDRLFVVGPARAIDGLAKEIADALVADAEPAKPAKPVRPAEP